MTGRGRVLPVLLAAALALATGATAFAQQQNPPAGSRQDNGKTQEAPRHARPNSLERTTDLEFLFGALKAAPDDASAKAIETRILSLWLVSGSDTADLLMARVKQAVDAKELDLGIQLLDSVVEIRPEYLEAWNRRATLHFLQKDYFAAIADLRQVLAREPRHFGALVGLGMIMQEFEEDKIALQLFRSALAIHPHLARIGDMVTKLTEKVEGRPI